MFTADLIYCSKRPLHALSWSVKVFQREVGFRHAVRKERARQPGRSRPSSKAAQPTSKKTSCAPRLASCPPPASVMVIEGDPPAGRGQLATARQTEAPHRPGTSCVTVDRSGLPRKPEVPEQWRTALPQGVEVDALVVPCSGLPAAVEDPYPLERQRPHGGLIRAALRSLLPVIGARPERFVDGLACPFDKGLAQEGRTLPAPVHPALLAAALGDRGDARVLLQFIGALEAVTLLAECSQQARRQIRTCSGQAVKQVEAGQRSWDCRDFLIEHVDRSERCAQLRHQHQRAQSVWCNDTGIVSKRHSAADRLQTPLNQLCTWKKVSSVFLPARLTAGRVGQRVRKSQNSTVSMSSNHSRA